MQDLKNCIELAVILSREELIRSSHLMLRQQAESSAESPEPDDEEKIRINITFDREVFSLEALANQVMGMVLEKCGNNKASAAELLKLHRNIFLSQKIKF